MSASKPNWQGNQAAQWGPSFSSPAAASAERTEPWGTQVVGTPPDPSVHPSNQNAVLWGAAGQHQPYVQYTPIEKPSTCSSMDSVLHKFNSWSRKAESKANNIWHNLRTGSSVSEAAWGKMNVAAKAVTGGGFESIYRQTFTTFPDETLKKTFACHLSTTTGAVPGTLFLSNAHVAFCSDQPLSFISPSGLQTWSYYKVMIPLGKIGNMDPVTMRENPPEKYIQLVTVDGHEFWFMGFVNFEKASHHLFESISNHAAPGIPVQLA